MARQVGEPGFERRDVFGPQLVARHAAMHLQRPHGGDDDRRVGLQPGLAALDVEEFFGPEIGAEPGLGHDVIGQFERRLGGDHRIAAMRDVGERPAMDEGRVVLQRLHQVGRDRVLQQHRHRAGRLDLLGAHRPRARGSAPTMILPSRRFRSLRSLARQKIAMTSEATTMSNPSSRGKPLATPPSEIDDRAQCPVVHVEAAPPGDAALVDAELVAPIDVVVDHRRQQVVGGADRVEIAGEMEVDVLHRHDLGIAAAGGAALHAEAGPEARLAQADDRLLADMVQRVAEADRRRRLALAGRGRGDRGDQDQLAVWPVFQGARRSRARPWPCSGRTATARRRESPASRRSGRSGASSRPARSRYRIVGSVLVRSARHGRSPLSHVRSQAGQGLSPPGVRLQPRYARQPGGAGRAARVQP